MIHEQFRAYLDDFDILLIEIPYFFYSEVGQGFYLDGNKVRIGDSVLLDDIYYLQGTAEKPVSDFQHPHILFHNGYTTNLRIRGVVKTTQFQQLVTSKEELGVNIISKPKDITDFELKLFSPTSLEVIVEFILIPSNVKDHLIYLDENKNDASFLKLKYTEKGIWSTTISGIDSSKTSFIWYKYLIKYPNEIVQSNDPYAKITDSLGNAYFATKISTKLEQKYKNTLAINEAVIYEASVRDITSKLDGCRGSFEDFIDNEKLIFGHLTELGVTHLQLLPVLDYFGTTRDKQNEISGYNWGYNPISWFAVEDTYANFGPINNPEIQLQRLVKKCHDNNIGVILDVVYNHVWDITDHSLTLTAPYFHFRYDSVYQPLRQSGCGNDVASEIAMTRKVIIDSVKHLLNTYDIDGLRLDLMGLLDITTLNEIQELCSAHYKPIYLYGEGWVIETPLVKEEQANMLNNELFSASHFNDYFRDLVFDYSMDSTQAEFPSLRFFSSLFPNLTKSINYLSCHDGLTLADKYESLNVLNPSLATRIAFALLVLSPGVIFLQGGDEFHRTKKLDSNSYRSGDNINGLDFKAKGKNSALSKFLGKLIELRNEHKVFTSLHTVFKRIENDDISLYNEEFKGRNYYIFINRENYHFHPKENITIIFNNGKDNLTAKNFNENGVYVYYIDPKVEEEGLESN